MAEDTTSSLSATATVEKLSGLPNTDIGVEAIDSSGNAVTPSAGTCTFTVRSHVLSNYETLNDDGGTEISVNLTDPTAVTVEGTSIYGVKATPASLSGGGAVGIRLKTTQYGG